MVAAYPKIDELLARQKTASTTGSIEIEMLGPVSANMISTQLSRAYLGWTPVLGPAGQQWVGRGKQTTWQPNTVTFVENFRESDKKPEPGDAFSGTAAELRRLIKTISDVATPRMAGIVVDLQFSSLELGSVGPLIASFMHPQLGPLVDAEWRVASKDNGIFVNLALSTYETRRMNVQVALDPSGTRIATPSSSGELLDTGLNLRIDVNTKVNIQEGTEKIVITDEHLERLAARGRAEVARGLDLLRKGL